jgi:hypothetical protein
MPRVISDEPELCEMTTPVMLSGGQIRLRLKLDHFVCDQAGSVLNPPPVTPVELSINQSSRFFSAPSSSTQQACRTLNNSSN